ncbi:Hpt domain-containing protein [Aeromonas bivalvium]|uniref:Hpt domain-containing protein n=1 Tax=Aeromonas bivalvium TaxID=440079 RepID=UPI0005AB60EE|nr:Hpt domain-containing protein [Aeromonas bivalvium]
MYRSRYPLTWQAVRDVCYRHLGLGEATPLAVTSPMAEALLPLPGRVLVEGLSAMLTKWQMLPASGLLDLGALQQLLGTGESFAQMLTQFRDELVQSLAQVQGSDKALADWVHRQAGTISMLQAEDLALRAWHLEEKIRQQGAGECEVELGEFRAQLGQIADELKTLLPRP